MWLLTATRHLRECHKSESDIDAATLPFRFASVKEKLRRIFCTRKVIPCSSEVLLAPIKIADVLQLWQRRKAEPHCEPPYCVNPPPVIKLDTRSSPPIPQWMGPLYQAPALCQALPGGGKCDIQAHTAYTHTHTYEGSAALLHRLVLRPEGYGTMKQMY